MLTKLVGCHFGFVLLLYLLVSEILRHFLYQSDSKLKPIAKSSISFSHVTRESVYSGYLTAGVADDFSGFFSLFENSDNVKLGCSTFSTPSLEG